MGKKINNTRTGRSIINIIFGIINFAIKTIMVFIVRKIFIKTLGLEYLGLNSLFANILTIMSIAEVGISTAVSQTLYGYLANNEREKIGAILGFYKKANHIIAVIVAIIGCCLIPFLKFIITQEVTIDISLELIYVLTLANVIASYIFSYRKVIYQTNQRIDVLYNITSVYYILLYIAQIVILITTKNYIIYLLSNIVITIMENVTIHFASKKMFKEFVIYENQLLETGVKSKIKTNVMSLLYQKIGNTIIFGTDNILISILIIDGLVVVGKYSNYILITSALETTLSQILNAITASIGNSLIEKDKDENYLLFKKFNFIYSVLVGLFCVGFVVLSNDFIKIFFGEGLSLKTIDVVLLGISFYLSNSRYLVKTYKEAQGIISQLKYSYIIQAIINLLLSIILGKIIGITGIILGTIISTIAVPLWCEYYLTNKYYFKKDLKEYYLRYLLYVLVSGVVGIITWYINSLIIAASLLFLLLKFALFLVIALIIYFVCLCWTPECKQSIQMVKGILRK